jgi:site-specific DNA-methyltransferase (adenine-specific)
MGHLYRVLKGSGAMVLWCDWQSFEAHRASAERAGFEVRNCIVWAKSNHTAGDLWGNLGYKHEFGVFAVKGNWRRHTKRDVNLWQVPSLFSRGKRHHPTEKPVTLMERATVLVVPEGGVVLDPFMGSGTTGVACINTGRRFIGIERDEHYYGVAWERIEAAQSAARQLEFVA